MYFLALKFRERSLAASLKRDEICGPVRKLHQFRERSLAASLKLWISRASALFL